LHPAGILRRSQQPIDPLRAFIGIAIGKKCPRFLRCGNRAREIKRNPPQEFRIARKVTPGCVKVRAPRRDQGVNPMM
jgi:hypothetical protein